MKGSYFFRALTLTLLLSSPAAAQEKTNILVIWGDDIGYWNVSYNSKGMMGFDTPNIDRIANEGSPSPTTTVSSPAPPDAPPSSPDSRAFAPGS